MVRCDALTRPTTWEDYASLRPRTGRSQASETRTVCTCGARDCRAACSMEALAVKWIVVTRTM